MSDTLDKKEKGERDAISRAVLSVNSVSNSRKHDNKTFMQLLIEAAEKNNEDENGNFFFAGMDSW